MLDKVVAVAAGDPDLADDGEGGGLMVSQLCAGSGVLDAGRGDHRSKNKKGNDHVGHDAAFPAHYLLARVGALTRGGDAGGGVGVRERQLGKVEQCEFACPLLALSGSVPRE